MDALALGVVWIAMVLIVVGAIRVTMIVFGLVVVSILIHILIHIRGRKK